MSGLNSKEITIICDVLKQYPDVHEAFFFGSRAKGNYRKSSDVDIAIKGIDTFDLVPTISGQLNDETPLPYTFDVVSLDNLKEGSLRDHINRVAVSFYVKS